MATKKAPRAQTLYAFCPSYAVQGPRERARYLASARAWGRSAGLRVTASPLLSRYLGAGAWLPVEARVADLTSALSHDVLWACRGGYGCIDLVRPILAARPRGRPRLIGYSDVTVLHACWRVRGWGETYYGNLGGAEPGTRAAATLRPLLRGQALEVGPRESAAVRVLRPGRAAGPCFAACLTVLAGLCGTPAQPDLRDHVLCIEDIDEHAYQVDFALNQLWLAGALEGIVALAGGTFIAQHAPEYTGPTALEILKAWGDRLGVPVLARLPFGHMPDAMFLANGRPVEVRAGADGAWSLRFAAAPRRRQRHPDRKTGGDDGTRTRNTQIDSLVL